MTPCEMPLPYRKSFKEVSLKIAGCSDGLVTIGNAKPNDSVPETPIAIGG